jgi:hypothetical protein
MTIIDMILLGFVGCIALIWFVGWLGESDEPKKEKPVKRILGIRLIDWFRIGKHLFK